MATLHPLFYPELQIPEYPPQLSPSFARRSCNPFLLQRVKVYVIQPSSLNDGCDWTQSGSNCRSPENELIQPLRLSPGTHFMKSQSMHNHTSPVVAETPCIATRETLAYAGNALYTTCVICTPYVRVERHASA